MADFSSSIASALKEAPDPRLRRVVAPRQKPHWSVARTLHWASIYIAREHRHQQVAENGVWECGCLECGIVREHLVKRGLL